MAAEPGQAQTEGLYPALEPFRRELLEVGDDHSVYFEESGNPLGLPVVFVHGGPGSQTRPAHRRFFDPALFRIILFDQRGCGQSLPLGLLAGNATAQLVADMDRLRRHLEIERWVLFGGSWGCALSLAYAIAYAGHVAGLVLRGVFLGTRAEVQWYLSGVRRFVPEAWEEFTAGVRGSIVAHYQAAVHSIARPIALAAARRWCDYEARVMDPANPAASSGATSEHELLARVRVQLHFMANDFFLRHNELSDNLWRMGSRPVTIVQGRNDLVCPPAAAAALAAALPDAELRMVAGAGHSALQAQIAAELCAATRRMHARVGR